jgi:hypothetical protein
MHILPLPLVALTDILLLREVEEIHSVSYMKMEQSTKSIIYFVCGHKEVTAIDTVRSSQQNRNLWFRIKKWSSTTPEETKHQQSGSLCTSCKQKERKQIEEAAELQVKMAENAAKQLGAQGRIMAAPPTQGVGPTIAALALPSRKALTKELLSAERDLSSQGQLQIVNGVDWQQEAARNVQRDLERMSSFWEGIHSEHLDCVQNINFRSEPKFCTECKKMETSLADPKYRRQHGKRPDVKRLDGVWYGTDGIEEDPWSVDSPFLPVNDHLSSRARNSIPPATPPREMTPEELEAEKICYPEEFDGRRPEPIDRYDPDIHHSVDMEDSASQSAVQDLMESTYHQPQQHETQGKGNNSQSHPRLRDAGLLYLKVMETRRNSRLAAHPAAEREITLSAKKEEDHAALQREYLQAPESNLDSGKLVTPPFLPNSDEKLRRLPFLALYNTLPPLPPQTSEELTALESIDDLRLVRESMAHISPNAGLIEPALRHSGANSIVLLRLQSLNHSEPDPDPELLSLPPLPLQDEEELQALDPSDIFCRRNAISCEGLQPSWFDEAFGQSHELEFEILPREVSSNGVQGEPQNTINTNPFPPPAEIGILPDTIYDPEYRMDEEHTLSRYPPRPSSPEEPLIDPFSPVGEVVIQKIRDYFYIPAKIRPSRFTDYFNERARISEGMREDRILASPTSGLHYESPQLSKKSNWSFFFLKSREDDIQRREEIVELWSRVQWPELDESPEIPEEELASREDETSEWEESGGEEDGDEDSDESSSNEELDQWRNAETRKLITSIFDHLHASPHSQFSFASESARTCTPDLPPRPATPSPYSKRTIDFGFDEFEADLDSTDQFFSDEEAKEGEPEMDPEMLVISAPETDENSSDEDQRRAPSQDHKGVNYFITRETQQEIQTRIVSSLVWVDPKSPHIVKKKSPLRNELVYQWRRKTR